MKKVVGLLVMFVIVLAGCSNTNENAFVVGSDCGYAPSNWTTNKENKSEYAVLIDGSKTAYCDGYDVKVATEIAKELDKELVIKKISFDGLIPALQSGEIDAIVAGMSPTKERKQVISFSDAYFISNEVELIMVKKDSELANATTLQDFANKKVTAQVGTLQLDLIKQIPNVDTTAVPLESYNDLIQALKSDTIDGYVVDKSAGEAQENANPDFKVVKFSEGNTFVLDEGQTSVAIGMKKNDPNLEPINTFLKTINDATRQQWMDEAAGLAESGVVENE